MKLPKQLYTLTDDEETELENARQTDQNLLIQVWERLGLEYQFKWFTNKPGELPGTYWIEPTTP